jgi:hypothetical protein
MTDDIRARHVETAISRLLANVGGPTCQLCDEARAALAKWEASRALHAHTFKWTDAGDGWTPAPCECGEEYR